MAESAILTINGWGSNGKMENKWLKEQSARRRRRCGTRKMAINFYLCPFVCRRKICIINNYLTLELASVPLRHAGVLCVRRRKNQPQQMSCSIIFCFQPHLIYVLAILTKNIILCNFTSSFFCLLMCVLISPPWCKKLFHPFHYKNAIECA